MLEKVKKIKDLIVSQIENFRRLGAKGLLKKYREKFDNWLEDNKKKIRNLQQTNYNLALYHLDKGNFKDAVLRFKIVRKIWENNDPKIDYYLGRAYCLMNKYELAKKHLNSYLDSSEKTFTNAAKFSLQICEISLKESYGEIINIPCHQIQELSTEGGLIPSEIAAHRIKLQYAFEQKNKKAILDHIDRKLVIVQNLAKILPYTSRPHDSNIIEIGCCDGLLGMMLRSSLVSNIIAGADFCPNSVSMAKNGKINQVNAYNEVILIDDLIKGCENLLSQSRYDVAIVYDLLNYTAEPENLINYLRDTEVMILCFRGDNTITDEASALFNKYREDVTFHPQKILKRAEEMGWHLFYQFDNGPVMQNNKEKRHYYTFFMVKDAELINKKDSILQLDRKNEESPDA